MGEIAKTYENWLKGGFPTDLSFIKNANKNIPKEELDKIQAEQKRIYEDLILEKKREKFTLIEEELRSSKDKQFFLKEVLSYLDQMIKDRFDPFDDLQSTYKHIISNDNDCYGTFRILAKDYMNSSIRDYSVIEVPLEFEKNICFDAYINADLYVLIRQHIKKMIRFGYTYIYTKETKNGFLTFTYHTPKNSNNKNSLIKIYNYLIDKSIIDNNTSREDFELAFSGKTITRKLEIKWFQSSKDFGTFLYLLIRQNLISDKHVANIAENNYVFVIYNKGKKKLPKKIADIRSRIKNENTGISEHMEDFGKFIIKLNEK